MIDANIPLKSIRANISTLLLDASSMAHRVHHTGNEILFTYCVLSCCYLLHLFVKPLILCPSKEDGERDNGQNSAERRAHESEVKECDHIRCSLHLERKIFRH